MFAYKINIYFSTTNILLKLVKLSFNKVNISDKKYVFYDTAEQELISRDICYSSTRML